MRFAVIEAGFLPAGASTKNAGFACFGSVSEIIEEIRTDGEDRFLEQAELRWKGLGKLRSNLGDVAIDFHQHSGYEIFKDSEFELAQRCVSGLEYLNKILAPVIGKTDIYSVSNAKIADFGFSGIKTIIQNKYEGQIDTGKMMAALIRKVSGMGVQLFNNYKLDSIDLEQHQKVLSTSRGVFYCKNVIVATNAFAKELLPDLDVVPGRGQVLVTAPIPGLRIKGTFHYNKGYTYFRNIDNRILLGGFRNLNFDAERTIETGITIEIQTALEQLLYETIIPGYSTTIDYRWSGVMGFGSELKPIVKQISPGLYCAVRCNGMGIAMGSILGEQVADLIG